jgi:hypothetical protein
MKRGKTLVIKPGLTRWFDLGSIRPGGWTGPSLIKDWPGQQLGKPGWPGGSTYDLGKPGQDIVFFFFQMWDLKLISIYNLYSQEKNYVFSIWDKNFFDLNTST